MLNDWNTIKEQIFIIEGTGMNDGTGLGQAWYY